MGCYGLLWVAMSSYGLKWVKMGFYDRGGISINLLFIVTHSNSSEPIRTHKNS